jgi:hypothetical protein
MILWKGLTSRRGSVFLEAVLILPWVLFGNALALEVVRRGYLELVVHHASFLEARAHAFRSGGKTMSVSKDFLKTSLGESAMKRFLGEVIGGGENFRYQYFYRYKAFLSFPWKEETKHHFEVVRECKFPLSSH